MKIHQNSSCTFICDDSLKTSFFEERKLWESADLIIADPPYNIGDKAKVTKSHGRVLSNNDAWGGMFDDTFSETEYFDFLRDFLKQSFALLVPGGSLFCYIDRKFSGDFIHLAEKSGFLYKNMVSFIKVNSVPKLRANNFGSAFEIAVWLIKPNSGRTEKGNKISRTKPRIFNSFAPVKNLRLSTGELDIKQYHNTCSSNVFLGNIGSKKTGHPCEKYDWQIVPIIRSLSLSPKDGGNLIIDLFAGGFNSGLVCQKLERNYIGIEKNEHFWSVGCKLLNILAKNPEAKITKEMKIQPK